MYTACFKAPPRKAAEQIQPPCVMDTNVCAEVTTEKQREGPVIRSTLPAWKSLQFISFKIFILTLFSELGHACFWNINMTLTCVFNWPWRPCFQETTYTKLEFKWKQTRYINSPTDGKVQILFWRMGFDRMHFLDHVPINQLIATLSFCWALISY